MKRTPLRRCSVKQAKALKEYVVLRKQYLIEHPFCEIGKKLDLTSDSCGVSSSQIHHTKRRGRYLNDTSTWLATCAACHTWTETHARLARELGLIST